MTRLVAAQMKECDICNDIINMGRNFQKEQGFVQWTDEYPNKETIINDINSKTGYVLKIEDTLDRPCCPLSTAGIIAGYMCIDFNGEPAYENIEGKWRSEGPYAVVHRMTFDQKFRGKGLAAIAFSLIEELCIQKEVRTIRVDTDRMNKRMQHILKKCGFVNCGTIVFQGGKKLAYDKIF